MVRLSPPANGAASPCPMNPLLITHDFIQAAASSLYNLIFKQNFTMLGFVFAGGFAFELGFNSGMNKYWDYLNRGRQWKDIRAKYAEADDEE
ncbi:ubiquinol-cytochrome C reductase [Plectosphaerella cucumerina]|uniref:Complex III subunit 9 n=1 Tax=Plectosphaerella cucumerina TaxID=40658 RepID=A0A8K0X1K9_9PEZI|nr:ubiquinol-cytochrome C reductase [Plectosphaerella cucumerina]